MNYDTLDELIKIPQKTDAGKEKKKSFKNELINLLNEEGYTKRAEDYLYSGFLLAEASPFYEYIKNKDNKYEIYRELAKGEKFNSDKQTTIKLELNLLALFINEGNFETNIIRDILISLPDLSINSESKRFKDLSKFIEKAYINVIHNDVKYPDINEIGLTELTVQRLIDMFKEAFSTYEFQNEHILEKSNKLFNWINSASCSKRTVINGDSNIKIEEEKIDQVIDGKDSERVIAVKSEDIDNENEINLTNEETSWEVLLDNFKKYMINQQNDLNKSREKTSLLEKENQELRKRISSAYNENNGLKKNIEVLNNQISELYLIKSKNENQIEDLRESINKKNQEIEDRKKMGEMVSRDNSKQYEEFINRISSKLKVEYRDYKDAEDIEMNVDLGENMRLQLKSVFDILKNNGIQIK